MAQSLWIRVLVTLTALVVTSLATPEHPDRQSTPSCSQLARDLQQKIAEKLQDLSPPRSILVQLHPLGSPDQVAAPNTKYTVNVFVTKTRVRSVYMNQGTGTPTITTDGKKYKFTGRLRLIRSHMATTCFFNSSNIIGGITVSYQNKYSPTEIALEVVYEKTSVNAPAVVKSVDVTFDRFYAGTDIFFSYNPTKYVKEAFAEYIIAHFPNAVRQDRKIHGEMLKKFIIANGTEKVNFESCV